MRIRVLWLVIFLWNNLTIAQEHLPGDTLISFQSKENTPANYFWKIEKGKWGILDSTMQQLVPCIYDYPFEEEGEYNHNFSESCDFDVSNPVILCSDSLSDLIDLGKGVVSPKESIIIKRIDSMFVYRDKHKLYGLLNARGDQLIPPLSSTNIARVFDSLFLLSNQEGYYLMNSQKKVVLPVESFTDSVCYSLIADLIRSGILKNRDRFDFEYSDLTDEEIGLAWLHFNRVYLKKEEAKLPDLLDELCDDEIDFCKVKACFRYLSAQLAFGYDEYQVDLDCGKNIYSTMDGAYYRIGGVGSGIIEFRNDELMARGIRVYLELSNYSYFTAKEGKLVPFVWPQMFNNTDVALLRVNQFVDSLVNGMEEDMLPAITEENLHITDSSNFYIGKEGLVFLLYYLDEDKIGYPDSQYELLVPYDYLKAFIPEESPLYGFIEEQETGVEKDD